MFRDTNEELKRLEQELLEEPDTHADEEELLEEINELLGDETDEVSEHVSNTDRADVDPEELSRQLEQPQQPKEKLTGLVVAALLLTAGILGILAWWISVLYF